MMKKVIHIEHNFLSPEECEAIIGFYQVFAHEAFHYETNNTFPIDLKNHSELDGVHDRVLSLAQSLGQKPYRLDNHELVKWVPTSKMGLHKDFTHDDWSAILYLNDNFFGGNTLFEGNLRVSPQRGTIIMFNGCNLLHGVDPVLNGDRYTMAYWLKENA